MASVISPSNRSGGYPDQSDNDDGHSNDSQSDFVKPSVHFEQLDQVTVKRRTISKKEKVDSQKSFKTYDSKTIVTVETQI